MKKELEKKLANIVGSENVLGDEEALTAYFRDGVPSDSLISVRPNNQDEVVETVKLASAASVPVFTMKDARFAAPLPETGGIIIDFRRMNVIDKIDVKNLTAHIQRGVTWAQLLPELASLGVKALLPASSTSPYVLEDMMNRVIMRQAARFPEVQISNLRVVLADGRIHLTGSHALSEYGSDSKDDGGPNISRWYIGAEDIYGIPVRASIWIYPVRQAEKCLFFGFEELAQALAAIRDIPRKEVCDQALAMNSNYLRRLVQHDLPDLPPWLVLLDFEGEPPQVDFYEKVCREDALTLGGRELNGMADAFGGALGDIWRRPEHSHGFYSFIKRVPEFHELAVSRANDSMGELFVSHGYGRAAWCEFDHLGPNSENVEKTCEEIGNALLETGAYFDRPLGELAKKFYAGNPAYSHQIKRIKNMVDPEGALNPGQLLEGV